MAARVSGKNIIQKVRENQHLGLISSSEKWEIIISIYEVAGKRTLSLTSSQTIIHVLVNSLCLCYENACLFVMCTKIGYEYYIMCVV